MKTKKYYLVLTILIGVLCVPTLGEVEGVFDHPGPVLLGQANPALSGIEQLYVVIVPSDAEPNKESLVWTELNTKVTERLSKDGIKIIAGVAGNILNIVELRIDIDMLKLDDAQKYVFHIQTSLSRAVYLPQEQKVFFKTDVWDTEPVMQVVSAESMPAAVTKAVLEQVEEFIHACLAANPPKTQPCDADDISMVPKEPVEPVTKSTVAEYKYVASKNSDVFHKPDCSWAKRIKAENLIGYNSRDEAVKAGKRPCKRCNP